MIGWTAVFGSPEGFAVTDIALARLQTVRGAKRHFGAFEGPGAKPFRLLPYDS